MDSVGGLPRRGTTFFAGSTPPTTFGGTVGIEGHLQRFRDLDPTTGVDSSYQARTGRFNICRFVRNVSGMSDPLLPKRVVKYASAHRYKRVDGYCNVDYEEVAGVVDDFLASGIPNNDLGWIVVAGPALVTMPASQIGDIAIGQRLVALTAAASTHSTTAGRPRVFNAAGTFTAAQTTDGTAFKVLQYSFGSALSAVSSSSTNSDMLVNVDLVKAA